MEPSVTSPLSLTRFPGSLGSLLTWPLRTAIPVTDLQHYSMRFQVCGDVPGLQFPDSVSEKKVKAIICHTHCDISSEHFSTAPQTSELAEGST